MRTTFLLGGFLACALMALPTAANADDIKLNGCLVRGDGDGAGYLLFNAPGSAPALTRTDDRSVTPSIVGTTGAFSTIFYWLDGNGELKNHVGHRVEIEGDLQGDLKEGEIKLDRDDRWTEVTVKSGDRTMKAKVPNASIVAVSDRDDEHKSNILVRRVSVEKVKMLAAACQ